MIVELLWACLPLATLIGCVLWLRLGGEGGAGALARGLVVWTTATWLGSNLLSWFTALGSVGLRWLWSILAVACWAAVALRYRKPAVASV